MLGSNMTAFKKDTSSLSVREKDKLAKKTIASYQKMAAAEGIGTGAGGFMLGVADFPLLLSIKMKCLFTLSSIYGFDVKDRDERLYLLLIFQLAFSSDEHRKKFFPHWRIGKRSKKTLTGESFSRNTGIILMLSSYFSYCRASARRWAESPTTNCLHSWGRRQDMCFI